MFGKLGEKLERVAEHLGIIKPFPTLFSPETPKISLGSSTDSQNLYKTIAQKQRVIDAQQETIERINDENIKFSRLIGGIALSVGIILGGVGANILSQANPDGVTQKISSKVAKILGGEKTSYDYVLQDQSKDKLIAQLQDSIGTYKKLTGAQDELLKVKKLQLDILTEKFSSLSGDINELKEILSDTTKKSVQNISSPEKTTQTKVSVSSISEVFNQVDTYVTQLNQQFSSGVSIKYTSTQNKRVLVWLEVNGKKSLGYYADSPKYKQRLSQDGISNWAHQTLSQMKQIELIEKIASSKNVSRGKTPSSTPISLEILPQYSGEVKVVLRDNSLNKSVTFTVSVGQKDEQTHQKFYTALDSFFM